MEDGLREKVGLLRERIRRSGEDRHLYRELSDLLFQAGKISAAMNILERSLETAEDARGADAADQASAAEGGPDSAASLQADPHAPLKGIGGREGKWLFDRGLEFADAYLYEDAVECFLLALESGRETFETHYCLAGVYKSLEKPEDAERHCRRSIAINARFAPAHILLGSILKRPGRLDESVACCKRAVLLDPDCLAAYYDLACYYSLLGRREQGLAAMEMALCKGFSDFDWLLKDPDLDALRRNPEFDLLIRSYREKSL